MRLPVIVDRLTGEVRHPRFEAVTDFRLVTASLFGAASLRPGIAHHARALPQHDARCRPARDGGAVRRLRELEIVDAGDVVNDVVAGVIPNVDPDWKCVWSSRGAGTGPFPRGVARFESVSGLFCQWRTNVSLVFSIRRMLLESSAAAPSNETRIAQAPVAERPVALPPARRWSCKCGSRYSP
jgi:hypothetical protein